MKAFLKHQTVVEGEGRDLNKFGSPSRTWVVIDAAGRRGEGPSIKAAKAAIR